MSSCGLFAHAQQPAKIPRIGFLFIGTKDQPHLESFRQGLRDLGYIEGKNIVIEYRYAEGRPDALPALAAELVGLNVDVILTTILGQSCCASGNQHDSDGDLGAGDPVRAGLVKSLARPGGNLTGLSSSAGPGMREAVGATKEAVPKDQRRSDALESRSWPARKAATSRGQDGRPRPRATNPALEIKSAGDIDRAFDEVKKTHANALIITGGTDNDSKFRRDCRARRQASPAINVIRGNLSRTAD